MLDFNVLDNFNVSSIKMAIVCVFQANAGGTK